MKGRWVPLRYTLASCRPDLFWFPAALWALFVLMVGFMFGRSEAGTVARGFLGYALPLLAGILAAGIVLDDTALELRFATPYPAWRTLIERLGLLLGVIAAAALTYQGVLAVLGVDLSGLGNFGVRQLAWLVPSFALMAVGCTTAFAVTNSIAGSLVVGGLWIVETLMKGVFMHRAGATYFFLALGATDGFHPALRANQLILTGLALALLSLAWMLLKRQERYL